ncbi:hypothetical protein ACFE04_015385 [Oxalis oulophora]
MNSSIYNFYITQNPNSSPSSSNPNNNNLFEIQLNFTHALQLTYPETLTIQLASRVTSYRFHRKCLRSPQLLGPTLLTSLLDATNSPIDVITQIVHKVISFGIDIDNNDNNNDNVILVLTISVVTPYDNREEIDRVINESMGVFKFEPASEEAIEELERVDSSNMFVRASGDGACIVCLEEFQVGCHNNNAAARMPCGHVYHYDCLVTWLRTSRFCPLCRYAIPD